MHKKTQKSLRPLMKTSHSSTPFHWAPYSSKNHQGGRKKRGSCLAHLNFAQFFSLKIKFAIFFHPTEHNRITGAVIRYTTPNLSAKLGM